MIRSPFSILSAGALAWAAALMRRASGGLRPSGKGSLALAACLVACLAATCVTVSQAPDEPTRVRTEPAPRSAYAGTAACARCHQKEAATYALTPHALDSAVADAATIHADFSDAHNVLRTSNPNLIVAMTEEPNGFFQSGIDMKDPNHPTGEAERMDIAVGSGRHSQTYLYWKDDELYQLPASFWGWSHEWVLSPGFPAGQIHFDRPIVPRCLECHGSYFTWLNPPANRFDRNSLVLGIECERCHGPGAAHVSRERGPATGQAGATRIKDAAIVNPARLPRARQMDLCALCHAGAVNPIGAPLRFQPGDNIRDYLEIPKAANTAPVDVHGNQVGALEKSKCFGSGKMTCSTCHNVHQTQEDAAAFAPHCLTCHTVKACGRYQALGEKIRGRCIDCHMPLLDSTTITTSADQRKLHALLRAHTIAIYAEAAAKVERGLRKP